MRRKTQLIKLADIEFDERYYPRTKYNWLVAYNYANAMKQNYEKFPLITVTYFRGTFMLIDGKHRFEAMKMNKMEHAQVIVVSDIKENEIYVEAVKLNSEHGYQFSPYEKAKIIINLRDMKLDDSLISEIIHIPLNKISSFVAKRMVNTLSGEDVLKAPIKHLAGTKIDTVEQDIFATRSQSHIIQELIVLLENPEYLRKDKKILKQLERLKDLIDNILITA